MNVIDSVSKFSFMALLAMTGCTTMSPETGNDDLTPVVAWTDGLSAEQIVEAMPVWVDEAPSDSESSADTDGGNEAEDYQISWTVPADTIADVDWKIYVSSLVDDAWIPIPPDAYVITKETDTVENVTYDVYTAVVPGSVVLPSTIDSDTAVDTVEVSDTDTVSEDTAADSENTNAPIVVDYRVAMVDPSGNETTTEVSVVVIPPGHPVRVTFSEQTSANAPSGVTAIYNGIEEVLWSVGALSGDLLPQTVFLSQTIADKSLLSFTVNTDFTGYGFDETHVARSSSSSFCKVSEESPNDSDVHRRLKFKFEDLPLSALSYESGGVFDYNDVVLFVDIMNP
ncbi:MAG: hypothetical protein JXX14_21095 [Deltaproteobacteria bacterium]|nr:hypothetical protein [Deltaproteobacteria bacterium]